MSRPFPYGPQPFDLASVGKLARPRYGQLPEAETGFWEYMIRQRRTAWWARQQFRIGGGAGGANAQYREQADGPVWCFTRYGRTVSQLPFGTLVYVGGEHEDWYDADFCIYNDVVVEDASGDIRIFGYPKDVFPPTDFHTATVVGRDVWLIGSLGYKELRREGETQVMRLDADSLRITPIETSGDNPGWISSHDAFYDKRANEIVVSDGKIWVATDGGDPDLSTNVDAFALSLDSLTWRRLERS